MKHNDIYDWKWKDEKVNHIGDPYHCKARKAIFTHGQLLDLYWMNIGSSFKKKGWSDSRSGASVIDLEHVEVEFVANIDDLIEIPRGSEIYYNKDDVVDLHNLNSFYAPIYLREGAERSKYVMLQYAEYKLQDAISDLKYAERSVEKYRNLIGEIHTKDLNKILL